MLCAYILICTCLLYNLFIYIFSFACVSFACTFWFEYIKSVFAWYLFYAKFCCVISIVTVCEYIDLNPSNICWKWMCRAGKSLSSAITRPWLPMRFLLIILNLSSKKHFLVNCFQKIPASPERISSKIHPCSMDSPRECTKGGQMRHWKGLPQTHCGSHKSQHSQSGENEKCLQGIVVLQRPT